MEFLATTIQGLEEIGITEIRELIGKDARKEEKGKIRFRGDERDVFTLNYLSQSLHRIIILLEHTRFQSLSEIYEAVKGIDFREYIHETQSFAIRASRIGDHDFTSMDVAREAGQGVIDSFGKKLKVDLENPNVIIRVYVREDELWIGIDTTGESLHKRNYRSYSHPAPLKPSIAYALVRIVEWKEEDSLIDPFCGSGTIPIEAARFANKIPNPRRDFAFWNLKFLPRKDFMEKMKEKGEKKEKNLKIYGCDISKKHVEGALENAERAGVKINFFQGDATKISLNYDKIVTNPPYGIRMGRKSKIGKLYQDFYKNMTSYDSWNKAVVLTASPELLEGYSRRIEIVYGDLPSSILIFE
ncbi:MAG: tRNA (guanine(6)-N2)-methyltransferase [Candidatus Syntropharchaeia archaeon]